MKQDHSESYKRVEKTALGLLARRRHSKAEVRRKLSSRGFDAGIIEQVLLACERLNYINDETTAEFFIEELIRKRLGLNRIRQSMILRGFSQDLIRRMIDTYDLENRELEIAEAAARKKQAVLIREKDVRKRREKLIRFLRSRGFQAGTISAVVDRMGAWNDT